MVLSPFQQKCYGFGMDICFTDFLHDCSYEMSTPVVRRRHTDADKLVNRLKNAMPDKFQVMVQMHLSFILDLSGSKLEEMFKEPEKVDAVPKRKSATPFSKKKDKHASALFGTPLSNENVARIYPLIEFLSRPENLKTEGLFRKTGNVARQRLLKEWLNEGVDLCLDQETFTPHDCATVLKNYLSELPEPLLTERHYQAHLQVVDMMSQSTLETEKTKARSKQMKALQLMFLALPPTNCLLLECLIDMLHRVSRISENMMTAQSLGTVFAPCLLCSRKMPPEELQHFSPKLSQAVSFMVENGCQIFKTPRELAADIANFWREMETPSKCNRVKSEGDQDNSSSSLYSAKKYGSTQAVNTVVRFAERKSSSDSDSGNDTQVALAKLYAHVQMMPDSSKKKKLLKQFNQASGSAPPKKHSRSKTLGEQIKKHFGSLHKHHKRRGSNDGSKLTGSVPWTLTKTIDIDENDNIHHDDVFITKTPDGKTTIGLKQPGSPAVHIVDLSKTPTQKLKPRKRRSSGSSDGSIPEKRPSPEKITKVPCTENEIQYLASIPHQRRHCPCTPKQLHNKPIAMVSPMNQSPISESVKKIPSKTQKAMHTPRSRMPLLVIQSPTNLSRESVL
ncbi:rho GTPase-activating protein 19-like isoform X1 [Saccostrea echinata]|uniref:rho GTPase-activating protein 19-like isoform X1 n=1 Tax=Saccostrea echinata TaxID=191078 RepID=UPI002A803D6F|nr:rho GTPase-activating protein 19-like isoform X1 [Saccostrea echinata]